MRRRTGKMKSSHRNFTAGPAGRRHRQPGAIFLMACCAAFLLTLPAGSATGANRIVAYGDDLRVPVG
jgi:hypothetical protein